VLVLINGRNFMLCISISTHTNIVIKGFTKIFTLFFKEYRKFAVRKLTLTCLFLSRVWSFWKDHWHFCQRISSALVLWNFTDQNVHWHLSIMLKLHKSPESCSVFKFFEAFKHALPKGFFPNTRRISWSRLCKNSHRDC